MTSPFASRLGTNYCPLDEEVLEIQRLLVEPLSRLKGIDDKIAELQKTVDELTRERDSVSTYVEAHKALLSPLRRLPLDIIQEIFVACLPTHRNCVMSAVEAPVLLGRICSSWRELSLSTPRLWARLHIAEPPRPRPAQIYEEKYVQRLATTKAWLGRSGHCPLSISLAGSQSSPPGTPDTVNPFLEVVLSYVSRWQHFVVITLPGLDSVYNLTEHDVPLLETLEIRPISLARTHQSSFGLLHGSKISSFDLTVSDINPLALPLRWENLTSLCLINQGRRPAGSLFTSDEALKILTRCTRLRTCQFRLVETHTPPPLEDSILELPHLSSLDITLLGGLMFSPGRLFSRLLLPELRSLRFTSGVQTSIPQNLSFPFLVVSPKLEQLALELQLFGKESLLHLLSVLPPSIQRLLLLGNIVSTDPFDDAALASLTPSPDNPAVSCPLLQELQVSSCQALSDHAVLRFVKARMAAHPATLRRVAILFRREQQSDIRPEIQPFVDSGIDISIQYPPPFIAEFSPWRGVKDPPQ
ncbi:hypothetical protein B0H16DRAFT_1487623 [Mycena metata]|uniref:F-box domain-containing protein n=1 Tax=Mycena metata TaxID=1033252 RepID=A0AAD7P2Z0_9AGAR|nr:hypothetical protein B0H16DRAFT_1487623 [Mycena metata]